MSTYAAHDISALSMQRIAATSGAPEPLRLSVPSAGAHAAAEAVTLTCMSRWCPAGGAADCNGRSNTVLLQCANTSALLRLPDNAAFVAQPVHTREELQVAPLPGPDVCYVQQVVY